MNCQEAGVQLLDDVGAPSKDVAAHLSGCRRCQELLAAHRAALGLRQLPWRPPPRASALRVRALWRRRLAVTGTFALLTAGALAALVAASAVEPEAPAGIPPAPAVVRTQPAPSFDALLMEVDSYLHSEVSPHDPALRPFGALPHLLTPSGEAVTTRTFPVSTTGGARP